MMFNRLGSLFVGLVTVFCSAMPALAQTVTPTTGIGDVATTINNSGSFTITGGTQRLTSLFHSFENFSPAAANVLFQLDASQSDVEYVIGRVTGDNVSFIDGQLTLAGGNRPDLFLINPNGISFGQNARLMLPGSFVASTAESLIFTQGMEFSASTPGAAPLLTVSAPIGFHIGNFSGEITVNNTGHDLIYPPSFLVPVTRNSLSTGLRVVPGETLSLLANGLRLEGARLMAESGNIELGSVSVGTVHLDNSSPETWHFTYDMAQQFADIHLTNAAIADASGNPGGAIQIQGETIRIQDSSAVLVQHQGDQSAGLITINAGLLEIQGALPNQESSLVLSENLGSGQGSDIEVSARQVIARDGSRLIATTFQDGGTGGNVVVKSTDSIHFVGHSTFDATNISGIHTPSNMGGGRGGAIDVTTPQLQIQDGGGITSLVLGGLEGGTIDIHSDDITLSGENQGTRGASAISATSFLGGDAGAIDIQTERLFLNAGGVISASTLGAGNAGNLTIEADEFVEIDGFGSVLSPQRSRITASGQNPPGRFQQLFGLPASPSGKAGNLSISAPRIQVRNEGAIAAENTGSGNAGQLTLSANSILLDQQGQVRTSTSAGQGGMLVLTVGDYLLLRHNSLLSATAGSLGSGGNIEIQSPIILSLENSDIIANAVQGRGGNIDITTQSLLGATFREQLTLESDITASSTFGVNGTVEINNLTVDSGVVLVALPETPVDADEQIATSCEQSIGSQFIASGRGGLPTAPSVALTNNHPWVDLRQFSSLNGSDYAEDEETVDTNSAPRESVENLVSQLVESSGWRVNDYGQIELLSTETSESVAIHPVSCLTGLVK